MRTALLPAAFLAAGAAAAQRAGFLSGEGNAYRLAGLDGGARLTSTEGVGRSVGSADLGGTDELTLWPDCRAEADGEEGTWERAFGGFQVVLPGRTVTFPLQRIAAFEGVDCPGG